MNLRVPYFDLTAQTRTIRPELDVAIGRNLDRGSFCLGPDVVDFEQSFARYCDSAHAVGFNSGTSALHIALLLLNVGPGDEVITTPMSFVATCWAITYAGAKPVFVDVDDATCNLDPARIEAAITPRTKAVMPVHLYGQPFDLGAISEICARRNLALVEDAAQAHGATYAGRKVGSFGAVAGFSFYPGKNLGACGEAGALVTRDPALAARARALREHGSTVRYYHDEIGFNYRMEGIQGAVLGVKLKHLDAWTARRREIAARYTQLLTGTPLKLPRVVPRGEGVFHLYVVRHPRRDELKKFMEANGVGTALHYPLPIHLQKCYASLGYQAGDFPLAEAIGRDCLSLPIYPEMTDEQVDIAAGVISRFFQ
ncbi:DegT/DnrJ/EryC1/StrS family aminotransferase [Opitutus sp. GAS368]|uniref:DegT/DnrJ/EryC1/StrS family aminotransferase n=1 Tax=Opitutus sp. GAS368 TaxID=1882749 RepID=UPI00087B5E69|nr:DegT/DnrJ/EryC1/StrS family aminotransferase [Opitutus sp. GAS368]SDS27007.1 dTDP-4-amino-4,6-dideoxygalactose transaminase [Opitutus sp. GAS368]